MSQEGEREPEWRELEARVAEIYAQHGYRVARGQRVAGNQADLIAEIDVPGAPPVRLVIEVKYTAGASLPKVRVNEYLTTARALLAGGQVTGVVMVSNRRFTEDGYEAAVAIDPRLRLLSLDQLRTGLIVNSEELRRTARHIELDLLPHHYIDCSIEASYGELDLQVTSVGAVTDRLPAGTTLVLLGDYGSGKTTALRRVQASAIAQHLVDAAAPVPVFVELRELTQVPSVDALVERLSTELMVGPSPTQQLRRLLRDGRLLLLLDGLDEAAVQASADDRMRLLDELAPLLFSPSRCILTTRATWFGSLHELVRAVTAVASTFPPVWDDKRSDLLRTRGRAATERFVARQRLRDDSIAPIAPTWGTAELRPLDRAQVEAYVAAQDAELRAAGWRDHAEVLAFLRRAYDLDDLVKRPILLEMVVQLMVEGDILPGSEAAEMTVSEVYAASVQMKLALEEHKRPAGQTGFSLVQRREFSERCAWQMLRASRLELTEGEVERCAGAVVRGDGRARPSPDDAERLLAELRACSFLTILGDGSMRFVHKSYFEYFAACRLLDLLLEEGDYALRHEIPMEVLAFVGEMAEVSAPREGRVIAALRRCASDRGAAPDTQTMRSNAMIALLSGADELEQLDVRDIDVEVRRRRRLRLIDCDLRSAAIRILGSELVLVGCTLDGSRITVDQLSARGSTITGTQLVARSLLIEDCHLDVDLADAALETCTIERSRARVIGAGPLQFTITDSLVGFVGGSTRTSDLTACRSLVVVVGPALGAVVLEAGAVVWCTGPFSSVGVVDGVDDAHFLCFREAGEEGPPEVTEPPVLVLESGGHRQEPLEAVVAPDVAARLGRWAKTIVGIGPGPMPMGPVIRDIAGGPGADEVSLTNLVRAVDATVEVPRGAAGGTNEG